MCKQSNTLSIPLLTRLVATGFFSGYSPIAPGTMGTLVGIAIYLIPGIEHGPTLLIIIISTLSLGIILSARLEKLLGNDPQIIVLDEIVGIWISLLLLPKTVGIIIIGFFVFRILDIIKPPPAKTIERIKNGFGIMLDDVFAGIYTNIILRLLIILIPSLSL